MLPTRSATLRGFVRLVGVGVLRSLRGVSVWSIHLCPSFADLASTIHLYGIVRDLMIATGMKKQEPEVSSGKDRKMTMEPAQINFRFTTKVEQKIILSHNPIFITSIFLHLPPQTSLHSSCPFPPFPFASSRPSFCFSPLPASSSLPSSSPLPPHALPPVHLPLLRCHNNNNNNTQPTPSSTPYRTPRHLSLAQPMPLAPAARSPAARASCRR